MGIRGTGGKRRQEGQARRLRYENRGLQEEVKQLLEKGAQQRKELEHLSQAQLFSDLLQREMLPTCRSIGANYSVATLYRPALHQQLLGGDTFDVFQASDGKIRIMVGDASGKDLSSAILANSARVSVRALAYSEPDLGAVLRQTNQVLCLPQKNPSMFMTMFLLSVDLESGNVRYASAGHPPPAILRADSGEVEFLKFGGLPLMIDEDFGYCELENYLGPGDVMVLYTDGVSEARRGGQMYDLAGIEQCLREHGSQSPQNLLDCLMRAVLDWSHGDLKDDTVVIVVRRDSQA